MGGEAGADVIVPGGPPMADVDRHVGSDEVGPNHFHALGAHVLRGRDFDARDSESGPKTVIVNQTLVKAYFPGVDPIGRTIVVENTPRTIVGVVADIQVNDVRGTPGRRIYVPILQVPPPTSFVLEARVAGDPARIAAAIRDVVASVDRRVELEIAPVNDLVLRSVRGSVLVARVTRLFGALALLLAALGMYAVTAYAAAQRTGEFGLRIALGAEPKRVGLMVLREAIVLSGLGLACGVPAGVAATRLIRKEMFGVGPLDPPSLALAIVLLGVTAVLASYVPARRAARVAPLEALRVE
jgi:hypothetical protein